MFIAMNRFRIALGREAEFESLWRKRPSQIADEPGFLSFDLLRGASQEDHTLYSSHTVWRSRADFEAWTRSEAFRAAHGGAGGASGIFLGHPVFEGFETIEDMSLSIREVAA